jgi:desulfoferrodoxin-like iron-binding protein
MRNAAATPGPDWDLGEWESVLTIHVGTAYVCRQCENIVMVTRGGIGVMQLVCCGKPMEKVQRPSAQETKL